MRVTDSAEFERTFPGAHVGVLLLENVTNGERSDALDERLLEVQDTLRTRFAGADRATLQALPSVAAYLPHYRAFGQTYHVLRQLESVALKRKPLVSPGGTLVSAMFAAEVANQLLTAGHDADFVEGDLLVDVSREGDRFTSINGQEREIHAGDMLMRDRAGIISAVVYGPDARTRIHASTSRVLFVTYAPGGIGPPELHRHLEDITEYVKIASPQASKASLTIVPSE
ncbi:MAG: hypothetical protein JOZ81_01750 [Chloroflexi bacterium]|nr:hypothetical protein [Chloroflexota bacterium]